MVLKRSILCAVTGVLLVSGLIGANPAAAAPSDSTTSDVFPGAQLGVRTGPQAAPTSSALAPNAVTPQLVACDGDGVSGKRVEALYVREPGMPDRYHQLLPAMRAWLANADDAYNDSAALDGRSRHLRYVTEAAAGSCQVAVRNVVVPNGSLSTFEGGNTALGALGYNRADRKYVTLTESTVVCGVSTIENDDQPGPANRNNAGPSYARVDAVPGCMGTNAIAHELGHSLGAVQLSAPHSDGSWHCSDQYEMMCYGGTPSWNCPEWNAHRLPDCDHDDYFNANPAAGSYLATHWNVANSDFLIKGDTVDSDNHPQVGFTYAITSAATGEAIDVIGGSTEGLTRLSQRARTDAPSQRWLMGYETGLQFNNVNSRYCADSAYSGTTPGTTVLQWVCNGQDGMRWAYLSNGDGTYSIINWISGLALTVAGAYPTPIEQQPYTGAANQRWVFNRIADPGPKNGASYYLTGIHNRENAEVLAGSTSSGAAVTHNPASGATSQQWKLQATGSYWRLVNVKSSKCLDLKSASATAGTQIRQATCSSSATRQQWTLRRVADGTYFVVNRYSNMVLNMTDGSLSVLNQQALVGDKRNLVWALKQV